MLIDNFRVNEERDDAVLQYFLHGLDRVKICWTLSVKVK